MIKKIFFFIIVFLFTNQSFALELYGPFVQGGLIIGKVDKLSKVFIDNKKIKISNSGHFIFGIDRDRKKNFEISVIKKGKKDLIVKKIQLRKFKIQKIDGLPDRKVTPNERDMIRIRKEGKLISKAKNSNTSLEFFFKDFIRPIDGVTTGVYGSQRILNGKPRRPHYGIDIAAPKGTKVRNSNEGKVILAEKDLFFTGGTIIIDHGHGLISIYSHLEKIFVKRGEIVQTGKIIATVGSTGRSTGPHLDFRLYCNNIPVDPDLVIKKL